jgi:hypothetical protein
MTKTDVIREPDFEAYGEVKVDSKNRICLAKSGKAGKVKITGYRVYRNSLGQYILDPQVSVPAYEAWLYQNPKALAGVKKGLDDARAGKLAKSPEDFSKYTRSE